MQTEKTRRGINSCLFYRPSTIVNSGCGSAPYRQGSPGKVEIRPEPTPDLTAGETSSTHVDKDAADVRRAVMSYDYRARILHVSRAACEVGTVVQTHRLPLQGGSGTQAGITELRHWQSFSAIHEQS